MEKEKEFNLKEKIQYKDLDGFDDEFIYVKDIKEFIRQLKEHTSCKDKNNCLVLKQDEIHKIIDKLSGFEE